MVDSEKLIVYYSCFNFDIEASDFTHIAGFLQEVSPLLRGEWRQSAQLELQLLNIRISKYALEFSCELYLYLLQGRGEVPYESFKTSLIQELSLESIWIEGQCNALEMLIYEFLEAAGSVREVSFPDTYKLLLSCKEKPELCPLVVASEEVTTLAQSIRKVLRRVSYPLDSLIGPERLEAVSQFLKSLSRRVLNTFQVTSQFATNIVEFKEGSVAVRVIQPASDFYDKALEVWMDFDVTLSPPLFAAQVKQSLGNYWNEKLLFPALHFCEVAQQEWNKCPSTDSFLHALHHRLNQMWKTSIVEATKSFQEQKE